MTLIPIIVSLLALMLSVVSILISLRSDAVSHKSQLEQLKGEVRLKLTSQTILVTRIADSLLQHSRRLIQEIRSDNTSTTSLDYLKNFVESLERLVKVGEGLAEVRLELEKLDIPFFYMYPTGIMTRFYSLKNDVEDFDIILNELSKAVKNSENIDMDRVIKITDGLLNRIGNRETRNC